MKSIQGKISVTHFLIFCIIVKVENCIKIAENSFSKHNCCVIIIIFFFFFSSTLSYGSSQMVDNTLTVS
jgi:hypothetical protein